MTKIVTLDNIDKKLDNFERYVISFRFSPLLISLDSNFIIRISLEYRSQPEDLYIEDINIYNEIKFQLFNLYTNNDMDPNAAIKYLDDDGEFIEAFEDTFEFLGFEYHNRILEQ